MLTIFLIIAYIVSCIINDRFSFFPLLGSFAAYGLFIKIGEKKQMDPENGKTSWPETMGCRSGFWFMIVFIIAEFFFSYYLGLCHPEVFSFGRIEIGGFELVNSFVVLIELVCAAIYFIFLHKEKPLRMNGKTVALLVAILIPFIMRDFFSVSQIILGGEEEYNSTECIGMAYRVLVLAAFTEEVVYRGMVFSELRTRFKPVTAAVIQSAIFTLVHSEMMISLFRSFDGYAVIHILMVFMMGLLAAGMTYRTRSLWPGIIMHFALDGGVWYVLLPVIQSII